MPKSLKVFCPSNDPFAALSTKSVKLAIIFPAFSPLPPEFSKALVNLMIESIAMSLAAATSAISSAYEIALKVAATKAAVNTATAFLATPIAAAPKLSNFLDAASIPVTNSALFRPRATPSRAMLAMIKFLRIETWCLHHER